MYRRRIFNKIIIFTLIFVVIFLGVGLAAFSSSLTISSSATVTPDSSTFSVKFSTSKDSVVSGTLPPDDTEMGENAILSGTTISGISATFTQPGQRSQYTFYVINDGKYTAYLNNINIGSKTCTPIEGTTDILVQAACDDIILTVHYGVGAGSQYMPVTSTVTDLSSKSIEIGDYIIVIVQIEYESGGAQADGDFIVNFGDIEFDYSTVD